MNYSRFIPLSSRNETGMETEAGQWQLPDTDKIEIDPETLDRCRRIFNAGAPNLALCAYDVALWRKQEEKGKNVFGNPNFRRIE